MRLRYHVFRFRGASLGLGVGYDRGPRPVWDRRLRFDSAYGVPESRRGLREWCSSTYRGVETLSVMDGFSLRLWGLVVVYHSAWRVWRWHHTGEPGWPTTGPRQVFSRKPRTDTA